MQAIILILVILPLYSLLYFGPAIIVGFAAKRKNRNFWGWFFLSFAALVAPHIVTRITYLLFSVSQVPAKFPYTFVSLFLLGVVYYLLFTKSGKCPKCKKKLEQKDWKERNCHACGNFSEIEINVSKNRSTSSKANDERLRFISLVMAIVATALMHIYPIFNPFLIDCLFIPIYFSLSFIFLHISDYMLKRHNLDD